MAVGNPSTISQETSSSVAIAVYAVPLFKEGGKVRFAYIPVGESLPRNDTGENARPDQGTCQSSTLDPDGPSSASASALTAELHATRPSMAQSSVPLGNKSPTIVRSLQSVASRTASHAKSTWDGWGRMGKGTWLRWLHDMGQTVTEDVSAEARLARGISAKATRVTVWHPDCVSQEEAHQQIATIVQVCHIVDL